MKRTFLSVFIFLLSLATFANEIVLEGVYQGKNLYVQNPFAGDNSTYCVTEVYLNGKVLENAQVTSSAFEIDLSSFNIGDRVVVKIKHQSGCSPKVINPQVVKATSAFKFVSFDITTDALIWKTTGEKPGGSFYIEQFINNNWIVVESLQGKSQYANKVNTYSIKPDHHSGVNKYRVKYLERGGQVFYTQPTEYKSDLEPVTFYPKRVSDYITLSRATDYEILDAYGSTVKKGKGAKINCQDLESEQVFYLNFDNKTAKFLKK